MVVLENPKDVRAISGSGYYIALRVGFAFPLEEVNELPTAWVNHYTKLRFMLQDPVIRWIYSNTGTVRWSEIGIEDPLRVLDQAQTFGLRYGVAVSCVDENTDGQRSFGHFARSDREFEADEIAALYAYILKLHREKAPPTNLTDAELEDASGVQGAKFCHSARFIAVASTREAIVKMAEIAVQEVQKLAKKQLLN